MELLSAGGLHADELGLAAALLHTSQIVGQMCDEYVDLGLLGDLDEPDGDDRVILALDAMRRLTRGQVRVAAEAFAMPRDALAHTLESSHAEIVSRHHEIVECAVVGEDGAVRREALGPAVIAAECLTGSASTRSISASPRPD